jgi:transposase
MASLILWPQEVRTMGKAISSDLRERIVRGVEAGQSRRAMAARFEVAPSTAVRIEDRYRVTGSVAPAKQGRPRGSGKLGPHRSVIIDKVRAKPDITMPDLAEWLEAQLGVTIDPSNLSKFLCKEGFTYKKSVDGIGERTLRRQGDAT